ncbi:DNA-directed RNA polymerase III subunit C31 [Penicillium ochrochloron]
MSRFGAKKGNRAPGAEFTWDADPGGVPDTAPTPLYPAYVVPWARKLSEKEQSEVNHYRHLRERFHEGPYYSVLDTSSSSAKKGSAARANFDPFHGMPSYSGRYQKKRRTLPKIANIGREYETRYFPRELWPTIMPNFRPNASIDGFHAQTALAGMKRGFEDDEDEEDDTAKRRTAGADEDEGEGDADEGELLEGDEEAEEEIVDDDFEDDEDDMGGDYNAEQYFDGGDDEFGDDGFGDGGGGGDEDTY